MEGPNKEAFEKWANPYFYECKLCRDKKLRHHDNHQQHLRKVHKTTVKDHCDMFDVKRLMHKCLVCKEERKDNEYVHCKRHLVKHFASMHYPQISLYEYFVQHILDSLNNPPEPGWWFSEIMMLFPNCYIKLINRCTQISVFSK